MVAENLVWETAWIAFIKL